VGGAFANAALNELADRLPTPTPPRHALTRAEGGEKATGGGLATLKIGSMTTLSTVITQELPGNIRGI
jgi:hypothetical protein